MSDYSFLSTSIDYLTALLNSNFSSALAGAVAGAWIAHHISKRNEKLNTTLKELRSINSAITFATNICTFTISFKSQYVSLLVNAYEEDKRLYDLYKWLLQEIRGLQ